MAKVVETLTTGMGLLISMGTVIAMGAGLLVWLDSRHASAMDVQNLAEMLRQSEIARAEYQIDRAQREQVRLIQIPEDERTREEVGKLEELKFEIDFKKRELKRLEDDS